MPAATLPTGRGHRGIALAALLVAGIVSQALIVSQQLAADPLALVPVNDALVYWQWAGDVASGRLVGSTPFLSAPLYPYALGILRALGCGLAAVFVLQAALHVATAGLLFRAVDGRFGFAAGLAGAAIYLALLEPAYYTSRILSCTLQLFLVVLLWARMSAARERPSIGSSIGVGVVAGLCALANPTMIAAMPLIALWTAWVAGWKREGLRRAGLVVAAAAITIAPATLHNWLACGELIPISAQGGVTFFHGNSPGAQGTYHGIEGIASNRLQQNADARALARSDTDGSWGATSAHYFAKGLDVWRDDPGTALRLAGRKLRYFLTGRNYGDIYVPALEVEDGMASRLALAPIETSWIVLPALLVLGFLLRDPRRAFPEAVLVLAPLLTVVVFWYSPRYRIPAVPILAALAGVSIAQLFSPRERGPRFVRAVVWGLAIASGTWNARTGFDEKGPLRAQHEMLVGSALVELDRLEEAERRFRSALAGGNAAPALADVLRRLGRSLDALEMLEEIVREQPESAYAHRSFAVALAESRRFADAEREFRAALALDPNDWEALSGLGNVLHATSRPEEAIAMHRAAIEKNAAYAEAHHNLGVVLIGRGRVGEGEDELREALHLDPRLERTRRLLDEMTSTAKPLQDQ
ncbi:MAG: tetratricopeptide repeat protein [Planctomycetota bacterium]